MAATSIIGTVIPQNQSPADYMQAFGPMLHGIFWVLDFYDMYHSWWFQFLLVALVANIVVCSIDRINATKKILLVKTPTFNVNQFRKLKDRHSFNDDRSAASLEKPLKAFAAKRFGYHRIEKNGHGFLIFAEKGRWTRFGVYAVHLSVVLLLIGGLIGARFGFDGFVNVAEGDTINTIRLRSGGQSLKLPFDVRCDDFFVSFYDNGMPQEFRSDLVITEDGRETVKTAITMNNPLRYRGINFFQSSYGPLAPDKATIHFTSVESKMQYTHTLRVGQAIDLPEGLGRFAIQSFTQSAQFKETTIGEAFVARYVSPDGKPETILLSLKFPQFDRMRKGNFFAEVVAHEPRYYTGLEVTRDPGVWVVYSGFIMMILGCIVTFFLSHQRLCMEVTEKGRKSSVAVSLTANKNKMGLGRRLEEIVAEVKLA